MSRLSREVIKRLRRQASDHLESFELKNGSRYYYDRTQALAELYLYAYDRELGHNPEPPGIWRKILEARDIEEVLSRFRAPNTHSSALDLDALYETERTTHND
jgi:hypothetical protein